MNAHRPITRSHAVSFAACVALGLLATVATAQGVYRIVGPDGRVTYSDQPPPSGATVRQAGAAAGAGSAGGAALPFELRQVANRFPVTLYTSSDCAPCNSGRNLLNARGIPYAERTVNTFEDTEALKRVSGESSLPFLTIGGQQIKGYSDSEWTQFLDAAGYPKQSQLPASYRRPAATPLVAVKPVETPPANTNAARPRPAQPVEAPVPVAPAPSNPAGIRF
ncbi:MAG: glutaredoxin family protein [Hydrogenophaga sp.]|jgi:glutaredoxin|nr:glutaredoxin family protein [Hydrogenophaga sp.]